MEKYYIEYRRKISRNIKHYAKKTATVYFRENGEKINLTYEQIASKIKYVSKLLSYCGISTHSRIAVVSPHTPYTVVLNLALAYLGYKAVLIDSGLPAEKIVSLISSSDVSGIFTTDKLYKAISTERIPKVPIFEIAENYNYRLFRDSVKKYNGKKSTSAENVIAIIFSSGTTGVMKGVEITYRSILTAQQCMLRYTNLTSKATYFNVLPSNHIAGYSTAMSCFLTGTEMGFISEMDAKSLLNGFLTYNPTNFIMIPKVYEVIREKILSEIQKKPLAVRAYVQAAMTVCGAVRKTTGIKLRFLTKPIWKQALGSNMKICGCGTAPCKKETVEFYLNLGIDFVDVYGSTETGFPITAANCNDKYPANGAGRIDQFKNIKVRVDNPDENGVGEILVKTPLIMNGYFNDTELTKASFTPDGYFHTGDTGYVDSNKNLHVKGRIKENIMMKSGKKVSPSDIDDYYQSICPDILIAACGISGDDSYDEIHLFIENSGTNGSVINNAVDRLWTKSNSNSLYRLSDIHVVDKIPVTSIGKVKRFMLKELLTDTARDTRTDSNLKIIEMIQKYVSPSVKVNFSSVLADDLELDSLTTLEMCVEIEKAYGVNIVERLNDKTTVADIENWVKHHDDNSQVKDYNIDDFPKKKSGKDIKLLKRFANFSNRTWKLKCFGIENIPKNGKYILCPNHESHFDTMWVVSALYLNGIDIIERCSCMGAEYVMKDKILGKGFKALGGIPVDRSGNPASAMKRASEYISKKENAVFMIHPEGTRTRDGKLGEFKNGAAKLAIDTNTVIIPVCINGAREIFPPDRKLPDIRRKKLLEIHFGEPIEPSEKTVEDITNEIRKYIIECKKRWN